MFFFHPDNLFILIIKQYYPFFIIILLYTFNYISILQIISFYLALCTYIHFFSKTTLTYHKTPLTSSLLSNCPTISSRNYKPPFIFPFNPLQLLLLNSTLVKPKYKVTVTRDVINEYGIALDWVHYDSLPTQSNTVKPVLLILPGLTGTVDDAYVMNICDKGLLNGYNVAIYQMRLLNPQVKMNKDGTPVNLFDDLDCAVDFIRNKYGEDINIYGIGFSYGANQLVRYLGERDYKYNKIKGGVSISNPFEFMVFAKLCEGTIYNRMLLMFLQKVYKRTRHALLSNKELNLNDDVLLNTITLYEFDKYYTAKIMGYSSPCDYYRNIGCARFIKNINVPLLCVHAMDDQITNAKVIPYYDIESNPNVILMRTDYGTHTCYLENEGLFTLRQWIVKPSIEFINAVHNSNSNKK
jgi:predicted alpha/beta-fold hydrolase